MAMVACEALKRIEAVGAGVQGQPGLQDYVSKAKPQNERVTWVL